MLVWIFIYLDIPRKIWTSMCWFILTLCYLDTIAIKSSPFLIICPYLLILRNSEVSRLKFKLKIDIRVLHHFTSYAKKFFWRLHAFENQNSEKLILIDLFTPQRQQFCFSVFLPLPNYDRQGRKVFLMRNRLMNPSESSLEEIMKVTFLKLSGPGDISPVRRVWLKLFWAKYDLLEGLNLEPSSVEYIWTPLSYELCYFYELR